VSDIKPSSVPETFPRGVFNLSPEEPNRNADRNRDNGSSAIFEVRAAAERDFLFLRRLRAGK
jgi:hypothetical protein